jgi:hypothetical protein
MKKNFVRTFALSAAIATAAVVGVTGLASAATGQPHTRPAAAAAESAYDIRLVAPITDGRLTVQVINKKTGQLVTNAHVSMRHWVPGHAKNAPGPQQAMVPLEPDGHGGYVCMREHIGKGDRVEVRAHVPGDLEGTWAELTIDN